MTTNTNGDAKGFKTQPEGSDASKQQQTALAKVDRTNRNQPCLPSLDVWVEDSIDTALYDKLIFTLVDRHVMGDWGDVSGEQWIANDLALENGGRIVGVFRTEQGPTFRITTVWQYVKVEIEEPKD